MKSHIPKRPLEDLTRNNTALWESTDGGVIEGYTPEEYIETKVEEAQTTLQELTSPAVQPRRCEDDAAH